MTPPFALDARLRGVTPPAHDTLWRVAMPNIGKAHLGLVCKSQGLTAVEKIAVGENVSFLERELAALQELASYPELSSSVPAILNVDSRPDHLAVFESALPGRSMLSLLRTGLFARARQHERWLTLAAAWIAQFQTSRQCRRARFTPSNRVCAKRSAFTLVSQRAPATVCWRCWMLRNYLPGRRRRTATTGAGTS